MTGLFDGKTVLVVGASSGIGAAIARRFGREGARVAVAARREKEAGEVVSGIVAEGGTADFHRVDVGDAGSVKALLEEVVSRYDGLQVAVNNAGIEGTPFVPTADYEEDVFNAVIDTNLIGVWRCMKHEIPCLGEGGVIINMSSIAGLGANEMMGCAYSASKHGIIGLTKTAAREYASRGIRINAICPGVIATDIAERSFMHDERIERKVLKMHPIGRLGTCDEVADTVAWMASEQSSFMTGHALVLDGGVTA
jgi:NAD(P)-dependent dehydrogenase (short-subunit alcohol dehydrogenase family)